MRPDFDLFEYETPLQVKTEIDRVIQDILRYNRYDSIELDRIPLVGFRSYHIEHTKYRIIFAICEECRMKGYEALLGCPPSCALLRDMTVVLLCYGIHHVYEWLTDQRNAMG